MSNPAVTMRPAPPLPSSIRTSFADVPYNSPTSSGFPSPVTTDSDGSVVYTPPGSRQPSLSVAVDYTRHEPRVSVSRPRPAKRPASPEEDLPFCDECDSDMCRKPETHHKRLSEKKSRKLHGDAARDAEGSMKVFAHWLPKNLQFKSNGAASGLYGRKIDTLRAIIGVCNSFLEEGYIRALEENKLDEFMADVSLRADVAAEHGPLFGGRLLNMSSDTCDHRRRSTECIVHGHPDWRQCREERTQANFDANLQRVKEEIQRGQASSHRSTPRL